MQVKIYKELSNFAPKAVGPFTLRQFAALVICAPICYLIFIGLYGTVGKDMAVMCASIPAVLAFLIGWTKPYGMYIEKFAVTYFKTRLLAPYRRKYIVKNTILESLRDADAAWEREHAPAPEKKKRSVFKKKETMPEGAIR